VRCGGGCHPERGEGSCRRKSNVAEKIPRSLRFLGMTIALSAIATICAAQQAPAPDFDALGQEAAERLAEYLRIRTVNPPGNETAGAKWLQQVLAGDGITAAIFESSPGRGNLYARLPGNGSKRPIVLLSHIDVVPATDSAWHVGPWSGVTRSGAVWGRGALDMKGIAIIEVMTMIALKRRDVPLSRDVILVANADEETNSSGAEWFAREKRELLHDAEFLLNEGGHNRLSPEGRTEYYGVGVTEKIPYWLRITARGSPGHGSVPRPDNAAARIGLALGRIAAYRTPIKLTPPAERYFKGLATRETDPRKRRWLADPSAALRNAAGAAFLTSNPYYNAILRNTISITMLRGSDKTNVIPPEASAELDVRLLPGERPADFVRELRQVIADSAVEIVPLRPEREATTSPLDGALIQAIRETVETMEPGALITMPMLAGFTDSYYYRAIGIGAYGVSPFRLSEADARTVHGNDERVTVENIRFGMEFFYRIVEKVAR
jgi:acetylornithine deacetylase/succinyl-diaminopimelate desuccinylase-like protein